MMDQKPEVEKVDSLEQALELVKASLLARQNAQKAPADDLSYRVAAQKQALQLLEDAVKLLDDARNVLQAEIAWDQLDVIRSIFRASYAEAEAASGNNGHQ